MVLNKYLAAILNIVAVLFAALLAALKSGMLTPTIDVQIGILVLGAIVVYWVPLLAIKAAGILKVVAAALTAGGTAIEPYLAGHLTVTAWLIVGIAVLNTLGVGVGVAARLTSAKTLGYTGRSR